MDTLHYISGYGESRGMPTGHGGELKQAWGSLVHLINDNQRRLHRSTPLRLIPYADLVRELAESDALKLTPTIDRSADALRTTRKSTVSHNVNSSHDLSAPKVLFFLQHADVINTPVSLNNFPFIIPPDFPVHECVRYPITLWNESEVCALIRPILYAGRTARYSMVHIPWSFFAPK